MSGGFCPACGRPTAADAKFCAGCGHALTRPNAAPATRDARPAAEETTVYELRPLVVRTFLDALISATLVGWVILWISRMGRRYRVTTERIETIEGVLSRTSRFLDLYRIEDFEIVEPWFLRMRGAGRLVIRSMDKDEPVEVLEAVPDVRAVHEKIRVLAREERTRRGVRVIETG